MNGIRLMIVDDREELCRELGTGIELIASSSAAPIQVVAFAHDGYEAIVQADAFVPDLILMDLEMPHLGGLSASEQIKVKHPAIIILALTIHDSPSTRLAVLQAGMNGLISKSASLLKIVEEINLWRDTSEQGNHK